MHPANSPWQLLLGRLQKRAYGIRIRYRMHRAFKKGRCRSFLAAL